MATRRPFWKWHHWKSIGFCLWPSSTCIWNLKLKFQSKLDLCSGNHVVYRQTDRRTRWIQYTPPPTTLGGGIMNPVYPPSNYVGRGYNESTGIWRDRFHVILFHNVCETCHHFDNFGFTSYTRDYQHEDLQCSHWGQSCHHKTFVLYVLNYPEHWWNVNWCTRIKYILNIFFSHPSWVSFYDVISTFYC